MNIHELHDWNEKYATICWYVRILGKMSGKCYFVRRDYEMDEYIIVGYED